MSKEVSGPMTTNQAGINLIKTFEGLRLSVYLDQAGLPTVGYGHMDPNMLVGSHITEQDAEMLLKKDLKRTEEGVTTLVTVPLNSNQFSALVCFSFNVGLGNLAKSTLLRLLNRNLYKEASEELPKWNRVKGVVVEGLTQRRLSEQKLFNTEIA